MNSLEEIKQRQRRNGVIFLSDQETLENESKTYVRVRDKENRIYSDEIVSRLPEISNENPLNAEWNVRKRSVEKLVEYISKGNRSKGGGLNILDLGCGNGWMSNKFTMNNNKVFALDLNLVELEQGARIFSENGNLFFVYGNICENIFVEGSFDLIIAASVIQYFSNLKDLLNRLLGLLKKDGEIHLIDSPFYTKVNIESAKKRSEIYYKDLGFSEMNNFYHHHLYDDLADFNYKVLYYPNNLISKVFNKFFYKYNSPFPWITVKN